ncbi:hypothetical protein Nstercoris_00890 [Nitrosomonas stercoris]|uniref:Exosortase-associated protein, TIGR04073 family n=1 Tax=Nitrosomonas stercoris TaxID=1444684 RepID=A0A4Y1YNR6_9PROT|nr:hypothetical protein Nstercoris_00890 [Nitrosomonas stercoris]
MKTKTSITCIFMAAALYMLPQVAMAGQSAAQSYPAVTSGKLVSGVANAATGFVELPKNIRLSSQQHGVAYGLTIGVLTGVLHTVGRTVVGALDVATFLIPTQPTVRAPYVWQDFDKETTYN